MTSFKTLGRLGTLCGVAAIVTLTAGCPFANIFNPDPCDSYTIVSDNNPCTTDTCDSSSGTAVTKHTAIANCCDAASDCADDDACTIDACANISTTTGTGTCTHTAVGQNCCNDATDCSTGEVCTNNQCQTPECTTAADCDDSDACTTDTCTGSICNHADVTCNANESCVDGNCVPQCTVDGDCADDGNACTTVACVNGGCVTTTETCDDNVACTTDTCDPATGDCSNADNCTSGTCDLTTGTCVGCETDNDCNDDNDCTDDVCNSGTCENTNNTTACDDGNACTTNDTCAAGSCAGTAVTCPAGQQCNSSTGNCQAITCTSNADCNDNASCTTDVCNLATGACEYTPIDTLCNDNLFCNGTEGAGSCDPSDSDAEAGTGCVRPGNPCANPTPICQESNDSCVACTTNAQCNDNFSCTSDTCSSGSCVNTPLDSLCPDPLKCDGVDLCDPNNADADATTGCYAPGNPCDPKVCNESTYVEGDPNTCTNCTSNADCSDGIPCTADTCDGATGNCSHNADNTLCPDTLFCNGDDVCAPNDPDADASGCVNGLENAYPCANACNEATNTCFACTSNLECSDGVACTTDVCDGNTGLCTHTDNCTSGTCNLQSGQCE